MAGFQDNLRAGGLVKGPLQVQPRTISEVPFDIQGITGQTAVLHRVRNAAGTTLFSVDNSGNIVVSGSVTASINEAITGNVAITGTLSVTGASTFTGAVSCASSLAVTGNSTLNTVNAAQIVTNALTISGITNAEFINLKLQSGDPAVQTDKGEIYTKTVSGIVELFYKDSSSNVTQITEGGSIGGDLIHMDDDEYLGFGNTSATPDAGIAWNTAQTVDGLYLGLSDAQNTLIIAEYGDRAFDFAHGAQTNPTLFIHSATQNTTQWISFAHNQTDAVIATGAGDLLLTIAGGNLAPSANDGFALGTALLGVADIFLATGSVINWVNGDITLTHTAAKLTWGGDGAVEIDFNNHEMTNVDINSGAIDGTIIGAASAAAGTFTNIIANGTTGLTLSGDGSSIIFADGKNAAAATDSASIYGSSAAGGAYPFLSNGHLVLEARQSGLAGDVVVIGSSATIRAIFPAAGGLTLGSVAGTGTGAAYMGALTATTGTFSGAVNISTSAVSSGVSTGLTVTPGAHTNMTASTEVNQIYGNFANTLTWATGNITLQRAVRFSQPTYAFAGASTITSAATVYIAGAPVAGTNATITNRYALWVGANTSRFDGGIDVTATTDSTSIATGALITAGGLGVTKAAWIGGLLNVAGAATFQSTVGMGALTATTGTFTDNISGAVSWTSTFNTTTAVGSGSGYRFGKTTTDYFGRIWANHNTGNVYFDTEFTFNTVFRNKFGAGFTGTPVDSITILGSTGAVLLNGSTAYGRLGQLFETNVTANYGGAALNTWSATAAEEALLDFNRSKSATIGTQSLVASGDALGRIVWRGSDGAQFTAAAHIEGQIDGTAALNDMPGRLIFATTADGASSSTQRMAILNTGVVTIGGTTNTAYSQGTAGTDKLEINTVSDYGGQVMTTWSASADHASFFTFQRSKGAAVGTNTLLASNDRLGSISWRGADGTNFDSAARITAWVDGTPSAGTDMPGRLTFETSSDNSAIPAQRMAILNSGVVTIGGTTNTAYGRLGQLLETNVSANYGGMAINTWTATAGEGPIIDINRSKSATIGTFTTAVVVDDLLGTIHYRGTDGVDAFRTGAEIATFADGTFSATSSPGFLIIKTTPAASVTPTERLRVTSGGVISTTVTTPTNITAIGAAIFTGGIAFTDVLNAWIDDATHGDGTTTLYIGNQTITTASDMRLKENIVDTRMTALDVINQFHVVDYNWNDKFGGHEAYNKRGTYTGLLAQEAIEVMPTIINANGGENCVLCLTGKECSQHGDWHVEYDHLVPTLVKAIQELTAKVEALTK